MTRGGSRLDFVRESHQGLIRAETNYKGNLRSRNRLITLLYINEGSSIAELHMTLLCNRATMDEAIAWVITPLVTQLRQSSQIVGAPPGNVLELKQITLIRLQRSEALRTGKYKKRAQGLLTYGNSRAYLKAAVLQRSTQPPFNSAVIYAHCATSACGLTNIC